MFLFYSCARKPIVTDTLYSQAARTVLLRRNKMFTKVKTRKKHDGRLIQARISPRVPFSKIEKSDDPDKLPNRIITAKQLSILLYHFYLTVDNPEVGFPDAEKTPGQFQAELNQTVKISTEHMQKLLWCLEHAFELGLYWSPAEDSMEEFVKGMLEKNERFNRLNCLIIKKEK